MKPWWIWCLLALFVVDLATASWWLRDRKERRHESAILQAAQKYEVPAPLIKAVVWQESRFDESARGRAGEIGLMQIRELAAREWAESERIPRFSHEKLADPALNVMAGTWYLGKLLRRYQHTDDAVPYALADYNAGRSNVLRWIQGDAATNSTAFLKQMDFPGTRRYITEVMERREVYKPQYAGK